VIFEKKAGWSADSYESVSDVADYYESVVAIAKDGKQAANWVTQDVLREMKERSVSIADFSVSAETLGAIIQRVVDKKITNKSGREVFSVLLEDADEAHEASVDRIDEIITERGLEVISDTGALEEAVKAAIAESPKAVEDFKAGKQQAVGAIIGKVMRLAKGADAKTVRELIIKTLQKM